MAVQHNCCSKSEEAVIRAPRRDALPAVRCRAESGLCAVRHGTCADPRKRRSRSATVANQPDKPDGRKAA